MAYKLIITERADDLIDKLVVYIINKLKNKEAASHLLDELDDIYSRLAENPYQFPESKDDYLNSRGYREAHFSEMSYKAVFRIDENKVYIVGIFHDMEEYEKKI